MSTGWRISVLRHVLVALVAATGCFGGYAATADDPQNQVASANSASELAAVAGERANEPAVTSPATTRNSADRAATERSDQDKIPCRLVGGPRRAVTEVLDGETVRLDDGSEVRITGLLAPRAPRGTPAGAVWPPAENATRHLRTLLQGKSVRLRFERTRRDRYGRTIAHLWLEGDKSTWVAENMLAEGLVRAVSFPGTRNCARALLAAERQARSAAHGIWTNAAYGIRSARQVRELQRFEHTFQIVTGRVAKVARVRKRTYINFGDDWRTDFTAVIEDGALRLFEQMKIDLDALEGRSLEVRGWLENWNGPLIRITHPEQLQLTGQRAWLPRKAEPAARTAAADAEE